MAGTLRSRLCTAWGPRTPTVRASFDFGIERLSKRFLICVGRVFFDWGNGEALSSSSDLLATACPGEPGLFGGWEACSSAFDSVKDFSARVLSLSLSSLHTLGLSPFSAATALSLLFGHLGMRVSCHHASPYLFASIVSTHDRLVSCLPWVMPLGRTRFIRPF